MKRTKVSRKEAEALAKAFMESRSKAPGPETPEGSILGWMKSAGYAMPGEVRLVDERSELFEKMGAWIGEQREKALKGTDGTPTEAALARLDRSWRADCPSIVAGTAKERGWSRGQTEAVCSGMADSDAPPALGEMLSLGMMAESGPHAAFDGKGGSARLSATSPALDLMEPAMKDLARTTGRSEADLARAFTAAHEASHLHWFEQARFASGSEDALGQMSVRELASQLSAGGPGASAGAIAAAGSRTGSLLAQEMLADARASAAMAGWLGVPVEDVVKAASAFRLAEDGLSRLAEADPSKAGSEGWRRWRGGEGNDHFTPLALALLATEKFDPKVPAEADAAAARSAARALASLERSGLVSGVAKGSREVFEAAAEGSSAPKAPEDIGWDLRGWRLERSEVVGPPEPSPVPELRSLENWRAQRASEAAAAGPSSSAKPGV